MSIRQFKNKNIIKVKPMDSEQISAFTSIWQRIQKVETVYDFKLETDKENGSVKVLWKKQYSDYEKITVYSDGSVTRNFPPGYFSE